MPLVTEGIERHRQQWGREHVAECIRRGMAGEPGWFFAFERGHVVGTPWGVLDPELQRLLDLAVVVGGRYALAMRPPAGVSGDGKGGAEC